MKEVKSKVICRTEGCPDRDDVKVVSLEIPVKEQIVLCGVCMVYITDIEEV